MAKRKSESEDIANKLIEIGIAISAEKNLIKLLKKINEEARRLLSADKGTIYIIDEKMKELRFYITDMKMLNEMRMHLDKNSIAGYVGVTGEELIIKDVYKNEQGKPYSFNKAIDKQTKYRSKSMLAVPMRNHRNEIIGVVQLINKIKSSKVVSFTKTDSIILKALASHAAISIENAQLYKEIEDLFESFVMSSVAAIDARDPVTAGHSRRVAIYSEVLARAMNCFSEDEIKEIKYTALVHDIGKIGVREKVLTKENKLYPDELEVIKNRFEYIKIRTKFEIEDEQECSKKIEEIDNDLKFIIKINFPEYVSDDDLRKLQEIANKKYKNFNGEEKLYLIEKEVETLSVRRGNLTTMERKEMEGHSKHTFEILSKINFTRDLKYVPFYASYHHEKLDGSGYPYGKGNEDIPLQAKVIAVTDIYEALTSQDRKYKPAMPVERALQILKSDSESGKLDPEIVRIFIEKKVFETQVDMVNQ